MRAVRRPLPIAALALAALAAGCGGTEEETPVACLEGPRAYLEALREAPGAARLADRTSISECLTEGQAGGDLAEIGGSMVEAATFLNAAAREESGGGTGLRLGYLVGAAERGAGGTSGIHAELLRRLQAAARYSPDDGRLPAAVRTAYRRGYEAGAERG